MIEPHFDFEREAMAEGRMVAGIDEVGRGPLAGPVGVAAVILDPDDLPQGLGDFEGDQRGQARVLRPIILAKALSVSIVFASAEEIDVYNIRGAALRAMARAVGALSLKPDLALIDGRDVPDGLACPARAISAATPCRRRLRRRRYRQDDPRRSDAEPGAATTAIRLCRSRRLCG